ncbi:extracellular solute-binding protein [Fontivita pretiosa]|uniref:extracellular solute-binding protein n=1 Tax=Fontivita pretiosa TaxID=2989684 RepID=UPI003D183700
MVTRILLELVLIFAWLVGSAAATAAQDSSAGGRVVLYTSVDEPYARPIIRRFERQTGISVTLVTDAEAAKSAGLAQRLLAEKDRPRADVYWGNEIFHAIDLASQGVLAPYRSPVAAQIPQRWRAKDDLYTCTGLRARVIAISTRPQHADLIAPIKTLDDLTNPALKDRIGWCHPAFGTASGHFAALYVLWGEDRYRQFLHGLRANNLKLLGGNAAVVEQVAAGALLAGPTDNDDVNNARAEGMKVDMIIPDQGRGQIGTLLIPTTVALVKGAPNEHNAKTLIDYLLSPQVEKELLDSRFLAWSIRDAQQQARGMDLDYEKAARQMRRAIEIALEILQERK